MPRTPTTLLKEISPPPCRREPAVAEITSVQAAVPTVQDSDDDIGKPSAAAIEAGKAIVQDHLDYFCDKFKALRSCVSDSPRLSISDFRALYQRNQHEHGCHFVVHQHDHPIAGVHYDLRIQISATSTLSFAIPYGLPGNANSKRPMRMAIETRVHTIWNNLIESASHATGSLLIWDTGEYEVVSYDDDRQRPAPGTDDEHSADDDSEDRIASSDSQRLAAAFRARRIHLRLHGTKLPTGYTLSLRLPSANDTSAAPRKPVRKRRRVDPKARKTAPACSDSDENANRTSMPTTLSTAVYDDPDGKDTAAAAAAASDTEDTTIRQHNAYPGAHNSVGSVHQRRWFLSLARPQSGFRKQGGKWVDGFAPFFVRGRDVERSVVTGRTAGGVMEDEGVERFEGRKMWRPILE